MRRRLRVEEAVTKYGESCVDRGNDFSHPRRAFVHLGGARSDVRRDRVSASQHSRTSTSRCSIISKCRSSNPSINIIFI